MESDPIYFRALALSAWCFALAAQAAVDAPRTIRVVVDSDYAPYSFESDEGFLQGILIDQWREWERTTGIKVEMRGMDWAEALRRMRAGEFDVIESIFPTPERREYLDFTAPYATVEGSIYFRYGISGITDLASLRGFAVGVKAGDQHIDSLEKSGVTNLIQYANNRAIVEAAKQRAINVFVVDDPSALYLLHNAGIEDKFRHSAPLFRDDLRRAVRKGDVATMRAVTTGFAAVDPAELKRIDDKWLGHGIEANRDYVRFAAYAVAVAIVLLAVLVGWNRSLRRGILQRTAEIQALSGQREAELRLAIDTIPTMTWSLRADGNLEFLNRRWLDYSGLTLEEALKDPAGTIHPDDLAKVMESWRGRIAEGKGYEEEMRLRRADGEYRWFLVRTVPLRDERGNIVKWFGTSMDIEDRQRVADALRQSATELRAMSRQLVEVQESERRNLSRELHDRVGQNLTALKINLELLGPALNMQGDENARARMIDSEALLESTIKTIDDVTSELRPQLLDDFGLAAALERYAREFSARTGIAVAVRGTPPSDRPLPQIEIALFRIAQEALNNVAKHARAGRVDIMLEHANRECTMSVQDDGIGLEGTVDAFGSANPGLGMVTMRERAQAIGGRFEVGTLPEGGTRLTVRVPY